MHGNSLILPLMKIITIVYTASSNILILSQVLTIIDKLNILMKDDSMDSYTDQFGWTVHLFFIKWSNKIEFIL